MLRLHRLAMQRYDQAHSSTAAASHLSALRRSSMRALIAGGSFFQVLPTWRVQKMGVGVGDLRKGALLSAVSSCCSFSGTRKPAEHQTAMCQPGRLLATPLWPQPSPLAPGPSPQAPAPPQLTMVMVARSARLVSFRCAIATVVNAWGWGRGLQSRVWGEGRHEAAAACSLLVDASAVEGQLGKVGSRKGGPCQKAAAPGQSTASDSCRLLQQQRQREQAACSC